MGGRIQARKKGRVFFAVAEVGIIIFAAYVTYVFLYRPDTFNPLYFPPLFLANVALLLLFCIFGSLAVGLYNAKLRDPFTSVVQRIFVAVAIAYFFMGLVVYNLFPAIQLDTGFPPIALAIVLLLTTVFRYFVCDIDALGIRKKRLVILGAGERASIIEKRMRRKVDKKGFELCGYVPMSGDSESSRVESGKQLHLDIKNLADYVIDNDIDGIVVACDERRTVLPLKELFDCKIRGVEILDIINFLEQETGQIAVNLIYPCWVIYSNGFGVNNQARIQIEYILNALLAVMVLLVFWPFMLITVLLIYFDDGRKTGASVLFLQDRVGMDGVPFKIIKFRSMRPDAEKDGAQWAEKEDDRATRIGAWIRKFRIDEFPQLFNVLRGEMNFVGPRPERPEFVHDLIKSIPYYNQRHNVKPGITGWAQLNYPYGSSLEDSLEKLKYDLYYIKHRGVVLDLFILIRTVEVIVFGKGR